MDRRLELHKILCDVLGSREVYYQSPESTRMSYPAIVYSRSDIVNEFADNNVYTQSHEYEVIVMDYNPDSKIVDAVSKLPTARFNRHYAYDNLNHDVFTLIY